MAGRPVQPPLYVGEYAVAEGGSGWFTPLTSQETSGQASFLPGQCSFRPLGHSSPWTPLLAIQVAHLLRRAPAPPAEQGMEPTLLPVAAAGAEAPLPEACKSSS